MDHADWLDGRLNRAKQLFSELEAVDNEDQEAAEQERAIRQRLEEIVERRARLSSSKIDLKSQLKVSMPTTPTTKAGTTRSDGV